MPSFVDPGRSDCTNCCLSLLQVTTDENDGDSSFASISPQLIGISPLLVLGQRALQTAISVVYGVAHHRSMGMGTRIMKGISSSDDRVTPITRILTVAHRLPWHSALSVI